VGFYSTNSLGFISFQIFTGCLGLLKSLEKLVGGFNPSEKYARQIGSFPQVEVKIKNL